MYASLLSCTEALALHPAPRGALAGLGAGGIPAKGGYSFEQKGSVTVLRLCFLGPLGRYGLVEKSEGSSSMFPSPSSCLLSRALPSFAVLGQGWT